VRLSELTAVDSTCQECGAQLASGQDWCLECGSATRGSLEPGRRGWRSVGLALGATVVLVLGAAAAAYAALSKTTPPTPAPKVITTIAQAPATPSAPAVPVTPPSTGSLGAAPTSTPSAKTKPPKTSSSEPGPKRSNTTPAGSNNEEPVGEGENESESTTGGAKGEPPVPILLDTNAAATYDPYNYALSGFGDPRLAVDGDTSTAWTAEVEPRVAPRMAVGLVIDLHAPRRVGSLTLISSTRGMTVQVYGSRDTSPPESITAHAWTTLSRSMKTKKRKTHIKLRRSDKSFRLIVLWISRAPATAVGTPSAPGQVSVNELELFPAK
jgi:hypothetical protein